MQRVQKNAKLLDAFWNENVYVLVKKYSYFAINCEKWQVLCKYNSLKRVKMYKLRLNFLCLLGIMREA